MALTLEQIATLKEGQVLFLQNYPVTYECETVKGNICAIDNVADGSDGSTCFFPPCYLSLQPDQCKPKYDPCRLFKKGDKVRLVDWNGRKLEDRSKDNTWVVLSEETDGVSIEHRSYGNHILMRVHACFLELVTPVEELEPYKVTESSDYYGVDKDDLEVEAAIFWKKSHPNAKAAAEAERDRLNAEYRKEQGNG